MFPFRFLIVVLALLLVGPGARAEAASDGVFFPKTFELENGLTGIVVSNHRAPVVTHMLWYKVGAADEQPGKSGLAHYLEHLMFKGTPTIPAGEFSKIVARNGGQDNAFTGNDYTAYFQTIAADRLEMVMKMEADRMRNLALTPMVAASELSVILEERSQVIDSSPSRRFAEEIQAALHVHHPYGRPIIGWRHEMEGLTLDDVKAFYENWYVPNNAVLVVSGDVTLEEVETLARRYYGPIPRKDLPSRVRLQDPPLKAEKRVVLAANDVQQPSFHRLWHAPTAKDGGATHYFALEVLAEIMGGSNTSRLPMALTVESDLAVSAGMYYSGDGLGAGSLGVYASPRPKDGADPADMSELEAAISAELTALLEQGVTAEELEAAKARLLDAAVFARDSVSGPARVLGRFIARGYSIEDVEQWPANIAKVTVDQVNAAAQYVLEGKPSVTGLLVPEVEACPHAPESPNPPESLSRCRHML